MENTASARPTAWGRAGLFWLLTNALGAAAVVMFFLCVMALQPPRSGNGDNADLSGLVIILIAEMAALYSLLVIPMTVTIFCKLLPLPRRYHRLLVACLTIPFLFILSFIISTIAPYLFLLNSEKGSRIFGSFPKFLAAILKSDSELVIVAHGWVYLPAALFAAAVIYHQELFRLDDLPS